MAKEYAIIVAGGKGTRINSTLPKQFLELNGIPVLIHTLNAFRRYSDLLTIVLVLPENDFPTWNAIAANYEVAQSVILQRGGPTRFQSVKSGLEKIDGDGLVAIHDGVRPLVSQHIIRESFRVAAIHGTAVTTVPLKESLRMITSAFHGRQNNPEESEAVDRSRFRLVQTPQTFDLNLIKKAYQLKEDSNLTDDASVVEKLGQEIILIDGSYENIKITTIEDIAVAEMLLKKKS